MGLQIFGINNPNVSEMFTSMVAKYRDALAQKPTPWARTMSGFTSTRALRQKFPIDLTVLNGFREWVGARDVKDGDIDAFFIDSKPWERSISVPLDVALSGQADAYVNKVPNLVRAAAVHPNRLIADLLAGGDGADCWDGKKFFATNHPIDKRGIVSGTYRNLETSKPFNKTNFAFAKKAFRTFKAPDGRTSLGLQLTHIFAPTDLEETISELFDKAIILKDSDTNDAAAAESNIYYGAIPPSNRVICPELDGEEGVWYAAALNTEAMPFETQMADNGNPEIQILGDGTEHAIKHNEVLFAGKLFGNAGYAIPHCLIRFEPS